MSDTKESAPREADLKEIAITKRYLGNINKDRKLSEKITDTSVLKVYLNPEDRAKGRIHCHSDSGVAVGIIKSRDRLLEDGDIFETETGQLLLVCLQVQELLTIDLSELNASVLPSQLVHLGHVLGNQHYAIAIDKDKIYVKEVVDKLALEKIINNLNIPNLKISYTTLSSNKEIAFSHHKH